MWPFKKKTVPIVDIGTTSYEFWLRAQRPAFGTDGLWFFRETEMAQSGFAALGDDYVQVCVGAGLAAGEAVQDEEAKLQRLVASVIPPAPQNGPQAPVQDVTHTMAGIGKRQEAAARRQEHPKEEQGGKVLFGKKADEPRTNPAGTPHEPVEESGR